MFPRLTRERSTGWALVPHSFENEGGSDQKKDQVCVLPIVAEINDRVPSPKIKVVKKILVGQHCPTLVFEYVGYMTRKKPWSTWISGSRALGGTGPS